MASLRDIPTRAGGDGEVRLYAIDEDNNIVLPKISCNFVFGDEVTEAERKEIMEDMNATLITSGIYDLGPYMIVKYMLSYTSSYITNGLKGEISVSISFIYSAIRKSDGKSFKVNCRTWELEQMMEQYLVLEKILRVSETQMYLLYGDMWSTYIVQVSEQGDAVSISILSDHVPDMDIMQDNVGNVYKYCGGEILTYPGNFPLDGNINYTAQIGNNAYAFTLEDLKFKIYTIQNNNVKLYDEVSVPDDLVLGDYIGTIDGEVLFYESGRIIKYNPLNKGHLNFVQLSQKTNDLLFGYKVYLNGVALVTPFDKAEGKVVKVNMLDETAEIIPIDVPGDKKVIDYSVTGSVESDYMQLHVHFDSGNPGIYNVHGFNALPDLTGYEVHKVIPLK